MLINNVALNPNFEIEENSKKLLNEFINQTNFKEFKINLKFKKIKKTCITETIVKLKNIKVLKDLPKNIPISEHFNLKEAFLQN